ncbi:MAG: rRNA maturation RNase YbeY [Candidatus Omnitrophota bacterium]|jgi:probable rRNA maturation factor
MKIILRNDQRARPVRVTALRRLILRVCKALGLDKDTSFSVNFVDEAQIKRLNRRFFKKSRLTDVISLGYRPRRGGRPRMRGVYDTYLGDVYVCPGRVWTNAGQYKQPYSGELNLCVVHGILHLLGYEDTGPRAKKRMWKKQRELTGL